MSTDVLDPQEALTQAQEDQPIKFELLQADRYAQFLLHDGSEICNVVRSLRDNHSLVTIYFNEGSDFVLSLLVDLTQDEQGIILDYGSDEEINYLALNSSKLIFITTLQKVKVQWMSQRLEKIEHQGRPAFRCPLPEQMLRLQRRDYFRLTMRQEDRMKCRIPCEVGGKRIALEASVLDISAGGIAVMVPPNGVSLESEQVFPHCSIDLGELGTVTADLRIRSVFDVTQRDGSHGQRTGCQFVGLSSASSAKIQRYIMQIERERRAFSR